MKIGDKELVEWGIVTNFVIGTPPVRTKQYTVPGRNGALDATEALTGFPVYDNRPISITLHISKESTTQCQRVYDEIYKYCHGKIKSIIFSFDDEWYYEGRITVTVKQINRFNGEVTLNADCGPYAIKRTVTQIDASSTTGEERDVELKNSGMPTTVEVTTDAEIHIIRGNAEHVISPGTFILVPLLYDDEVIAITGAANVTITYQEGKL